MFADIVGFTPFSEGRDSEDIRAMLTRYFDRSREVVERFGGVVDKYIGDAVMAVWGAQTAHEDDAERGVRAALELIDSVRSLGEELGVALEARAGLMSGSTSVGSGGNERGLVVGDMVNTASRLQGLAEPGTVVVGRSTAELAGAAIEFAAIGEHTVKGKETPVAAFQAVRVIAKRRGIGRSESLVPPFVGREHEMRILKDLLHATARESRARLVSIVGDGGIGKSRLSDEFLIYIDGLSDDVYYHAGRSPAYGDGLTFWSLAEMVRQRCGIAETDDDHRTRTKLRTTLTEYVADAGERDWLEPHLAGLLGVAAVPDVERPELFAAWRTFFERVADRGPTIMVFEDIHWADSGLLDFVEEMVKRASHHPIQIVTLARQDLLERRPGWGSAQAHSVGVQLGPLADVDVRDLVDGMVPGIPEELRDRIVSTAAGIPLYAVEFVRMLVGDGTLVRDGSRWTADAAAELAIPDSLIGVVGARIDLLSADDRRVLEDAAILGHSFTPDGLALLRDETAETVQAALARLVDASLLELNTDPRSPERGQYQFVQALIREVAHGRLPKADRRHRHLLVAEYLQTIGDAGLATAIASHYIAAHEATPAGEEADDLAKRAVAALHASLDRAASLQSHEQAVALGRQALRLATHPSDRGHLLVKIAASTFAQGDSGAVEYALEAIEAFRAAGDTEGEYGALAAAGKIYDESWRSNLAMSLLEPFVSEDFDPQTIPQVRVLTEYARALGLAEHSRDALSAAERALIAAERLDALPDIVEGLINKGLALGAAGRARESLILMKAARTMAREHGLFHSERRATNNLAYLLVADSVTEAKAVAEDQVAEAFRVGEPRTILWVVGQVAPSYGSFGEWARFEELIAAARALEPEHLEVLTLDNAELFRRTFQGDPDGAERDHIVIADEYRSLMETEDRQIEASFAFARAQYAYVNGRFEEAFDRHEAARDPSTWMGDVYGMQTAALMLADPEKIRATAERLATKPFRGRRVEWLREINRGAIAALTGERSTAVTIFADVAEVMRAHSSPLERATVFPLFAALIGTDDPLGHALAREAYDVAVATQLTTFLDLYADIVIPPQASATTEEAV
jgi:class 3 adenylate cyclase